MGRGGSLGAVYVHTYMMMTRTQALRLSAYFKAALPEYHAKYQKAFEAGVWLKADPGPWLGRAVVYKLQVSPHVDGLDDGPTAAFPTGYFEGGEAYFPDLRLKLWYRPRDILIFFSGHLFHAVGEWKPTVAPRSEDGQTPGRVGHVFFFPRFSMETLHDKPADWMVRTTGGVYPDPMKIDTEKSKAAQEEKRASKRANLG
ncbi:hypothetical protein K474DRAFT_1601306 [Panus rudis PR-1116 ss-1]|nr:hypothetical protein K474DRAFT_1601306 [Panus rudis PR-1116 ss-1]